MIKIFQITVIFSLSLFVLPFVLMFALYRIITDSLRLRMVSLKDMKSAPEPDISARGRYYFKEELENIYSN